MPEMSDPFAGIDPAAGVMAGTPAWPRRELTLPTDDGSESTSSDPIPILRNDEDHFGVRRPSPEVPSFQTSGTGETRTEGSNTGRIGTKTKEKRAKKPDREDTARRAKIARRRKLRREFAAALVNVASALVVAYAALFTVASIRSPRPLTLNDLGFPVVWMALGLDDGTDADSLLVRNVRTGTYRTESGEELFHVRGQVENASGAGRAALYVVVEVVRGGQVIGTAESLATLDAGPERLRRQHSRNNQDLQQALLKNAGSLHVASGARAPFIAIFPLSSHDVIGASVRLSVEEGLPAGLRRAAEPLVEKQPEEEKDKDSDADSQTDLHAVDRDKEGADTPNGSESTRAGHLAITPEAR